MMAPLPTTAHCAHDREENPLCGEPLWLLRATARRTAPRACEGAGVDGGRVWEPFARNNQIDRASAGWAYRIGQADLRDVREVDGLFAVVNGCPPDEGVMVELA